LTRASQTETTLRYASLDLSRMASNAYWGSLGLLVMYHRNACVSSSSFIDPRKRRVTRPEADRRSRPEQRTDPPQGQRGGAFRSPWRDGSRLRDAPLGIRRWSRRRLHG